MHLTCMDAYSEGGVAQNNKSICIVYNRLTNGTLSFSLYYVVEFTKCSSGQDFHENLCTLTNCVCDGKSSVHRYALMHSPNYNSLHFIYMIRHILPTCNCAGPRIARVEGVYISRAVA